MIYKLMHRGKVMHEADSEQECSEQAHALLAVLDLFQLSGIELVIWREWATGKRQRVRAYYTRGDNPDSTK